MGLATFEPAQKVDKHPEDNNRRTLGQTLGPDEQDGPHVLKTYPDLSRKSVLNP